MFKLPKKTAENRDSMLSIRIRKSVLTKIKKMAKKNNLSMADVIEQIAEIAFEEIEKKEVKGKKIEKEIQS